MTRQMPDNPSSKTLPEKLPETLATRVQYFREKRDWTPRKLATQAALSLQLIEDIEAGLVLFLATTVRQKLARVLHIKPALLQAVEKLPENVLEKAQESGSSAAALGVSSWQQQDISQLSVCPLCEQPTVHRLFERMDLDAQRYQVRKVTCSACLFCAQQEDRL